MPRRYLAILLLLLCAACATPHDLVRVPGVEAEQVCQYLDELDYDPGWCIYMDSKQMQRAIRRFQESRRLTPADGHLDMRTWLRLQEAVGDKRKAEAGPAAPPSPAKPAPAPKQAPPPPPPPLTVGARVFAVERAKCLPRSGAWLLAYMGTVSALEGERVRVTLRDRVSYRHNPGEEGVDRRDWFCVPRRRHCYSSVPFGDWGGTRRPGQEAVFEQTRVRRISGDPKDALYDLARQSCR